MRGESKPWHPLRTQGMRDPRVQTRPNGPATRPGADSLTFHDDCASAALAQPATELGTTEFEIVAQHVKQRGGGVDVEGMRLPINFQRNRAQIKTKVWLRLARVKPLYDSYT